MFKILKQCYTAVSEYETVRQVKQESKKLAQAALQQAALQLDMDEHIQTSLRKAAKVSRLMNVVMPKEWSYRTQKRRMPN